ncbi:sensor histidine kinase [Microbacterium arabinogalactanolyticum]|uniref:sensor histidine kinase n=1 Tax=Microbacterium arabinogalactanolyticum TaxID=69365 RepID=UPI002554E810|nr:HAMP domain-containing sensor histidine kinase [Microbacterium arabinogalactanolyticum]GLC85505.1 two-component sensor histidine kinase [Microbacterium arabinogalactanolyticum]
MPEMIPLGVVDVLLIAGTGLACTVVVAAIALILLRWARGGSMLVQMLVLASVAAVSMAAAVLLISVEMYISPHDLSVLVWVIGTSLLFSLLAAWLVARLTRARLVRISEAVRRVGEGDVVTAEPHGLREFDDLSAELADVSERLHAARQELEQLDSARRRFFAWISHDLRTPLTAVRALSEAIEDGASAHPERYAGEVRAQIDTMSRMVDDLFELSKLTSGAVRLRTQQVELLDVVSDAVADVRLAAEQRGVTIAERGVGGHVLWADPHQLGRVVVNLLTNAVRHAPRDSEILVTATELDEQRLVLGILDHGSGVATSDLDRMFEVGWREDAARPTTADDPVASGAGLGLAIARGLARAHGGDVYAEHTGEGFRMNVLMPVGDDSTQR